MPGLAIVSTSSFGDTSLPRLDLTPIVPLVGAAYDWAADRLPRGVLNTWHDMKADVPLMTTTTPSQKPVIPGTGPKFVQFNGVNQRMDAPITMPGAMTVVLVARLPNPGKEFEQGIILSGGEGPALNIYRGAAGTWATNAGETLNHTAKADTKRHVFVVVRDGAGSVLNVDGVEVSGPIGGAIADRIRLGASGNAYFESEVSRLALLPFAADQEQRSRIVKAMTAAYL